MEDINIFTFFLETLNSCENQVLELPLNYLLPTILSRSGLHGLSFQEMMLNLRPDLQVKRGSGEETMRQCFGNGEEYSKPEETLAWSLWGREGRNKKLEQWQRAQDEAEGKTYFIRLPQRVWAGTMRFPPQLKSSLWSYHLASLPYLYKVYGRTKDFSLLFNIG